MDLFASCRHPVLVRGGSLSSAFLQKSAGNKRVTSERKQALLWPMLLIDCLLGLALQDHSRQRFLVELPELADLQHAPGHSILCVRYPRPSHRLRCRPRQGLAASGCPTRRGLRLSEPLFHLERRAVASRALRRPVGQHPHAPATQPGNAGHCVRLAHSVHVAHVGRCEHVWWTSWCFFSSARLFQLPESTPPQGCPQKNNKQNALTRGAGRGLLVWRSAAPHDMCTLVATGS